MDSGSAAYMCIMTISTGSATWSNKPTITNFFDHDYDGTQYDVGLSLDLSNFMHVKKIDLGTGAEQWSNVFPCGSMNCRDMNSKIKIGSSQSKVYTLISQWDSTINTFWTVFNFATGTVIGNRYLAPPNSEITQHMVDRGDYVYIIIKYSSSLFYAKYDPSIDSFVNSVGLLQEHDRIFANGSGNK